MGVSIGLGKLNVSGSHDSCSKVLQNYGFSSSLSDSLHQHYSEVVGGSGWTGEFSLTRDDSSRYLKWMDTVKDHPDVVSYSLRPLHRLVLEREKRDGVRAAIGQYLKENSVRKPPEDHTCWGSSSNCCPEHPHRGTLEVTIVRAWDLDGGDPVGETDGWVKWGQRLISINSKNVCFWTIYTLSFDRHIWGNNSCSCCPKWICNWVWILKIILWYLFASITGRGGDSERGEERWGSKCDHACWHRDNWTMSS